MTMIDEPTITRNTVIETVDRLIDECSHTCANLMLRFQTKDGREIRSNVRQFYGMLHSRYAAMSWLSDVTMIRLFVRGQRKAIAAAAVPVVDTELTAELAKVAGLEATIRAGLAAQFGTPVKRMVAIGNRNGVTEYDADTLLDITGRPA